MLELNLHPPTSRPGIVHRRWLLERLESADDSSVVAVIAPAGYGKTTVMAQWMASRSAPTAWLTIDRADNDPAILISSITTALEAAGMLSGSFRKQRTPSSAVLGRGVTTLIERLERDRASGWLCVDQLDSLRTRSSLDVMGAFLTRLPTGLRVVVTSRSGEGIPLPLLRSRGAVTELSMTDLAMDEAEAQELLGSTGAAVDTAFEDIMRRTEGWPAGIYLTALAIRAGAPAPVGVRGDDTFVADYLKHEVLGRQSSTRLGFLTRSSILGRLSGPLCDHVLEAKGSARLLERLERSNLLIVPLDRTRTWYRYHSLFQDFLRSELERREPEQIMPLHSRAASWLQEHGEPELAIEHAMAANEPDRAAQMVSEVARLTYAQGRIQTLSGWFNWLEDHGTMAGYPVLAAVGSLARALDGDERGADRLAVHAFYDSAGQPWSDDILSPVARILRSLKAETGLDQSLTDARAARSALPRSSEWLHLAIAAEALALTAMGDKSDAEIAWAEAVRIGEELEAQPVTTLGLAETALIASSKGDWATTEDLVERALEQISEGGLELYISSTLVFVMAARLFIRRGNLAEARAHMGRAAAIRPALTIGVPAVSMQAMLEMTKTFIELADVAGARRVMREASDIVAARPQLGTLRTEHEELKERLAALPAGSVGPTSLSSAELRLLPMLATHLTYPEIGERLFVSRHTVKTQAGSIYRKLGVSSRAEAVDAARTIGLLGS